MVTYQLFINNEYELNIDEEWGHYKSLEKNTVINIPDNLCYYVLSKVDENNIKIFNTLEANTLFLEKDNEKLIVKKEMKDDFFK